MTSRPAGWYPDPESAGQQRWWDGAAWTEFTTAWAREDEEPAAVPVPAPAPQTTTGDRRRWRPSPKLLVVAAVAVLVVLLGVGAIVVASIPGLLARCDTNYSGACVPIAEDVDCGNGDTGENGDGPAYVDGPVTVTGTDVYGLDRDGDGIACD